MLHIIQNDPEVPPGNYAEALKTSGTDYRLVQAFAGEQLPAVADCAALLVLGGAMGVHETEKFPFLVRVKGLIRQGLAAGIPYLGLCLGGQLLAEVADGTVKQNRWEELGTLPVQLTLAGRKSPLFRDVPSPFPTFQWHHDSFDLPPDAVLLASSTICPYQAFSLGTNAFGLQFHPEMLDRVIADWCSWSPTTADETGQILAAFAAAKSEYLAASWAILNNFLRVAGLLPED